MQLGLQNFDPFTVTDASRSGDGHCTLLTRSIAQPLPKLAMATRRLHLRRKISRQQNFITMKNEEIIVVPLVEIT